MVKVKIMEQDKDFIIKEVNYRKNYFNRKFRNKIEILVYFTEENEKDIEDPVE